MAEQGQAPGRGRGQALLLIDLQEDYLEAEGLAGQRSDLLERVSRLSAAAATAAVPVLLVTTEHSRDGSTWTLGMLEAGEGFMFHGAPGTQPAHELDTAGMTRLEKTRDSAWFGTDLSLRLRNLGADELLIAGVSTHGCVAQTARDAYAHNVHPVIVVDAVAAESAEQHEQALALLRADGQARMSDMAEVLAAWARDDRA